MTKSVCRLKLVPLVEVAGPLVAQLDPGNADGQPDHQKGDERQQVPSVLHYEIAEAVEEDRLPVRAGRAQRQDRQHGGQKGHRIGEGAQDAERREVSQEPWPPAPYTSARALTRRPQNLDDGAMKKLLVGAAAFG